MRHATLRAQGRLRQYGVDQLIGVQTAFHDDVDFALRGQRRTGLGRGVAVCGFYPFGTAEINLVVCRQAADACLRSYQDWY